MMHYLSAVVVAIVLASVTGNPSGCSNTYQPAPMDTTCSEASLKDCCEVSQVLLHC